MKKKILICTDLDRTLIPNGKQPESEGARDLFKKTVTLANAALVYVTGRDKALVEDALAEFRLSLPDMVVADVGASIYEIAGAEWKRSVDWDYELSRDWSPSTSAEIIHRLDILHELTPQPADRQQPFKVSFFTPPADPGGDLPGEVEKLLDQAGIPSTAIWSFDPGINRGLLDILPPNAGKLKAIEFIMTHLGFSLENTVFSGDSGNDLDVLLSSVKSILVANAAPDVQKRVALKADGDPSIYLAEGSGEMNGCYAAGIIEGLFHFFPELTNNPQST